jgi:SAM-dependent methyltransferase
VSHSAYERPGFAVRYALYRPSPPGALVDLLCLQAQVDRPELVVDLGCGTGLSTRIWSGRAEHVIGIDANELMLAEADAPPGVEFRHADAATTGLEGGVADIVTCSQSFLWMKHGPVTAEAARILRPDGVFAVYEHDVPPLTLPEVDAAFEHFVIRAGTGGSPQGLAAIHLDALRSSDDFPATREALVHMRTELDAERLLGFARSLGQAGRRIDEGASDEELGLDRLESAARAAFGDRRVTAWWSYRVALAIR